MKMIIGRGFRGNLRSYRLDVKMGIATRYVESQPAFFSIMTLNPCSRRAQRATGVDVWHFRTEYPEIMVFNKHIRLRRALDSRYDVRATLVGYQRVKW